MTSATPLDYADRISKLLGQAESERALGNDLAADKFMGKAQELMQQYEITDQMVQSARGASAEVQDVITTIRVRQVGIFGKEKRNITAAVCKASTVKIFWGDTKAVKAWTSFSGKKHEGIKASKDLEIVGFSRDLERLQLLDASVQLQAASALNRFEKDEDERLGDLPGWQKFQERRTFLDAFADGLAAKLYQANRQAREDFVRDHAAETRAAESEVRTGMELAVRSRRDSVDDWCDTFYATSGKYRGAASGRGGSRSASSAGFSAGQSASVGQGTVGGGRRAIGS